jgi:pimeloyl-ACP methyl ester carboxylesterase
MSATLLHTIRDRNSAVALLFLHGFSGNPNTTWGRIPEFIGSDPRLADWDLFSVGYTTRLVPDIVGIWSADAPLDRLALMLYTATNLPALRKYRSLALVAHSMGGLLVQRVLVEHADLAQRVSQVVLFGTPSAGLSKAGFFRFLKRQVRDMGDQSEFVQNLRAAWKARFEPQSPFRFTAVAGDQDEFVPSQSSIEPFPPAQRSVVPGNHLEIVKPEDVNNPSMQLLFGLLIGEAADSGPRSAARLAVESRDFRRAVELLEAHKEELDDQGLAELAIALEQLGRQADAIQLLEKQAQDRLDPMGVLAGRLKRRWLAERRQSDAERAESLYQEGYGLAMYRHHVVQARYHGINLAFFKLAFREDHTAAQEIARQVLDLRDPLDSGPWPEATKGEANLILGESKAALDHYRAALAQSPKPWQADSMFQQALRIADLTGDEATFDELAALHKGSAAAEG